MGMKIQMKLETADGTPVEYDVYNTINRVPEPTPSLSPPPATQPTAVGGAVP